MKLSLPLLLTALAFPATLLAKDDGVHCRPIPDGEIYKPDEGPNMVILGPLQCSDYFNPTLGVPSKIVQCYRGTFYTREVCDMQHYCIMDTVGRPVCEGVVEEMYDKHRSQTAWAKTATAFPTTKRWPEPTP